jgi:hypothetical protein
VLREEEEEMPVVAVQAKVFTMEIVKKKKKTSMFRRRLRRLARVNSMVLVP